jgi:maltooligosyltrehalose synthase
MAVAGPGRFALGAEDWGRTSVVLPEGAPTVFSDPLSNAEVVARRGRLAVGRLFGTLPVSVLVGRRVDGS